MSVMAYFARHSVIRLATFGIGVAAAFIVTPHVVHTLGPMGYGAWGLISGLSGYIMLLDGGVYHAVMKWSADSSIASDPRMMRQLYSTGLALNAVSGLITFCIGILLFFFADLFSAEGGLRPFAVGLSALLFFCAIGVQVFLRAATGLLAGAMRWTLLAFFSMLRVVLSSVLALVMLSDQYSASDNLIRMAVLTALSFITEQSCIMVASRKIVGVPFQYSAVSMSTAKELLRYGIPIFISQCGDLLKKKTQIYVVGAMLSLQHVALFAVANQFISYMSDVLLSAFGILSPYFSRMQSDGDTEACNASLLDSLRMSLTVSCLIGLGLIFYGEPFIIRWLGTVYAEANTVLAPLALAGIISLGEMPVSGFLTGIAKHQILAVFSIAQGVLTTVLCFPAAYIWGLPGVGWAVFAVVLFFSLVCIPYQVMKAANMPVSRYYGNMLRALVPQVAAQSVYYLCIAGFVRPEYLSVLLAGMGQTLVCAMVFLGPNLWTRYNPMKKKTQPTVENGDEHDTRP